MRSFTSNTLRPFFFHPFPPSAPKMASKVTRKERLAYKKGDVLLAEKPFAFVLKGKLRSARCDYCFLSGDLMKCAGCSFAHYCDRECQTKAWVYHKRECRNVKKVAPKVVPDAARMLARIIIKLEQGGASDRSFYTNTKFRMFKDLMSHYNNIKEDKQRMEHFVSLTAVLHEYLGPDLLPNPAELLALYGRMVINSFNILDDEMQSIGTGIYLGASIIDHSCSPNAVAVFEGTTLFIRTLEDVPHLNWSDVYISYIDPLNLPSKRQKELETMYYFLCQCPRCIDVEEVKDMTAVVCQNEDCDGVIPGGGKDLMYCCTKCNRSLSKEDFEKVEEVTSFTEQQLENMKDVAYLDICRMCLRKQDGLLHESNIHKVKILHTAMDSCIMLSNWESALEYGRQVKPYLRKYYGELHPTRGIFLFALGKVAHLLEKDEEARKLFLEALSILKVTMGDAHPLVKNDLKTFIQNCQV